MEFGPNQTGDLSHWHYDTFEVVWRDRAYGRTFVTLSLDALGEVSHLQMGNLATFTRGMP